MYLCTRARVCEYLNVKANEMCEYAMELFEIEGEREFVCLCVCERERERMRKILFLNIYKLFFHHVYYKRIYEMSSQNSTSYIYV